MAQGNYRLEACLQCDVVRLRPRLVETIERERDQTDKSARIGDLTVWVVPFCAPCRKEYDRAHTLVVPCGGARNPNSCGGCDDCLRAQFVDGKP